MYVDLTVLGIVLPADLLGTRWFAVLSAFVAINSVMYVVLAVGKALPRVRPRDWLPRHYHRAETRSIYPDGPL